MTANVSRIIAEFVIIYLCEAAIYKSNTANTIKHQQSSNSILKTVTDKILYDNSKNKHNGWLKATEKEIKECFLHNSILNLSAFISFKTYDLKNYITSVVNEVFNLLNTEREYTEFISVMQVLVDNKPPIIKCIHIHPHKEYYELKDNNGNIVPYKDTEFKPFQNTENKNSDEALISTLIAVSPKEIYIHANNDFLTSDVFAVINNIFSERISLCYDNKTIQ